MRPPEFWTRDGPAAQLLAPLGLAYGLGGRLRLALGRRAQAGVPVVCVGNLTVGGAGKTPVVLALLERLSERGWPAHVLGRGYGGQAAGPLRVDPDSHEASEVGDEALLLARAAPTWVARDRAAGARAAVAAGAPALVLDDGFQSPRLVQDLALVVVDAGSGFGNGRVLPAGPLRETVEAGLARADAVVLLGDGEADKRLGDRLARAGKPLLRARIEPAVEPSAWRGRRILAFAGIGRPDKVFATLATLGAKAVGTRAFADHHPYRRAEIEALLAEAKRRDAVAVTTEKDAVRLPPDLRTRVETLPVSVRWDDPAALDALLAPLFPPGG
ncbi:MAG TPA: tetraacyldisaccharide 4'-kinase, partial [Kiloniellales bacterium]|nr:tetraacyldisaccharide 4'-kinase [Kiloniellales bacterium]